MFGKPREVAPQHSWRCGFVFSIKGKHHPRPHSPAHTPVHILRCMPTHTNRNTQGVVSLRVFVSSPNVRISMKECLSSPIGKKHTASCKLTWCHQSADSGCVNRRSWLKRTHKKKESALRNNNNRGFSWNAFLGVSKAKGTVLWEQTGNEGSEIEQKASDLLCQRQRRAAVQSAKHLRNRQSGYGSTRDRKL